MIKQIAKPEEPTRLVDMFQAIADAADAKTETGKHPLHRITLRVPQSVHQEFADIASVNGISLNVLINILIDTYLAEQGRPGYADLAPWFPEFALRNKRGVEP